MNTAEILQKARSKVWYQHLIPVLNAQKDLSYAVIKGEALSVQAFGAPGRRSSADIDLLVDKSQLKKLEQVLTEHGFTTARLSRAQQIVARAFSHQVAPYRKALPLGDLEVDLNYDLLWGEWTGERLSVSDMLARRQWMTIYEQSVPVLDTVDAFVQLCLHHYKDMNSLYHLAQHNSIRRQSFLDVAEFWKRNRGALERQKEVLWQQMERYALAPYFYYMWYWTGTLLEVPELLAWAQAVESAEGRALLDTYGLTAAERKTWKIPMEQRLDAPQLPQQVWEQLTKQDQEKIRQEQAIFGGL